MKKIIAGFIYILSFAAGCTGDSVNPLMVDGTCSDNILNQDEEKTDCGGICTSCEDSMITPCRSTLSGNTIQIDGVRYDIREYGISGDQNYGYPQIYVHASDLSITISIPSLPETSVVFQVKSYFDKENEIAQMRVFEPDVYNTFRGKLYISYDNNAWLVEFCDIELTGKDSTVKASGRITYQ